MFNVKVSKKTVVGIIGLGYVGLPLAVRCSSLYRTIGFDNSPERIAELQRAEDKSGEVELEQLQNNENLVFTCDAKQLRMCNVLIVTVPTPITKNNEPDLTSLQLACETVGSVLKRFSTVIFESTVYPGVSEEVCVPIIERFSGLTMNIDFWLGYSPERINPGDREHRLAEVIKVTSGSNKNARLFVDNFYRSIIPAGTHSVSSIRVAEAAKVIENIQRDINIALVNEFALLFEKLDIDTGEVLEAAQTKWNFLPFRPGLVGGHCIGVDPYYLTYKAREVGFRPDVILAGRKINNAMPSWVASRICELLSMQKKELNQCKVLVLGITFKENCPDTRNSKTIELVRELRTRTLQVDVVDPVAHAGASELPSDISLIQAPATDEYDGLVLAVAHSQFQEVEPDQILAYGKSDAVVYDIKHVLPKAKVTARL